MADMAEQGFGEMDRREETKSFYAEIRAHMELTSHEIKRMNDVQQAQGKNITSIDTIVNNGMKETLAMLKDKFPDLENTVAGIEAVQQNSMSILRNLLEQWKRENDESVKSQLKFAIDLMTAKVETALEKIDTKISERDILKHEEAERRERDRERDFEDRDKKRQFWNKIIIAAITIIPTTLGVIATYIATQ